MNIAKNNDFVYFGLVLRVIWLRVRKTFHRLIRELSTILNSTLAESLTVLITWWSL